MSVPASIASTNARLRACWESIESPPETRDAADFRMIEFALGGIPDGPPPSEADFRKAGMTLAARDWPLGPYEFLWVCLANGADPEKVSKVFWYAPSKSMRDWYAARVAESLKGDAR